MKKYLFICLGNQVRSPAAAAYFARVAREKLPGAAIYAEEDTAYAGNGRYIGRLNQQNMTNADVIIESAGVSKIARKKLTREMAESAHMIFALDEEICDIIAKEYGCAKDKIVNLDILNVYSAEEIDSDLLRFYLRSKGKEERAQIQQRPEIKRRLTLEKVLELRREVMEKSL